MPSPSDFPDDRFDVSPSPDTVAESSEYEGANVCRVAALSTMLGNDREAIRQLAPELEQLGFSSSLVAGERNWADVGLVDAFADVRERDAPQELSRVWRWQVLSETTRPQAALAFLVDVLGSRLERESAAAAAALWRQLQPSDVAGFMRGLRWWHAWDHLFDRWGPDLPETGWWAFPWGGLDSPNPEDGDAGTEVPWDPDRWSALYGRAMSRIGDPYADVLLIRMLSGWRLGRGLRSPDPITRSLSMAAFAPRPDRGDVGPPAGAVPTPPGAPVVSTMIHGTWGWKGDWWRPRSDFHEFILQHHRPNLYSRGAKFSWSGAYSDRQRAQAAADFGDWASDVAPHGLQTVFAHSYGGDVAARAVVAGARLTELVLLSVPVTAHVESAADASVRVVDVRLRFDPVLGLARLRQRVAQRLEPRANVTEVLLDRWRYDHGASHREDVWREEDIARRGGL
jgi:hypothetical protein